MVIGSCSINHVPRICSGAGLGYLYKGGGGSDRDSEWATDPTTGKSRDGDIMVATKVLILKMRGIKLLLGNDALKRFKKVKIEYGEGKPKLRFRDLPVELLAENR